MAPSKTKINQCLAETYAHKAEVLRNLNSFIRELVNRAEKHDDSKLEDPELSIYAENIGKLENVEYGTDEYEELLKEVQPAIDHHYSKNRHHIPHFKNGINDMTLVDLIELLCDWKAATLRNKNGNIRKSIEFNAEKYGITKQLASIMENTVREHFTE